MLPGMVSGSTGSLTCSDFKEELVARKKKTSPAEDFLTLIAMLPWWVGVALAIALYFGLHAFATSPLETASRPDQMGGVLLKSIARQFAQFGQFLIPFLCLVGAAASAWRRHQRKKLAANVSASGAADVNELATDRAIGQFMGRGQMALT
ncbi:MAG: hypothetical protein ABIV12_16320 [Dokdonella sp.]|uniref:hypothetical protein n=1 Tax=Dokdonella sp. TaxID=2291710 RepID=UPI003262CD34